MEANLILFQAIIRNYRRAFSFRTPVVVTREKGGGSLFYRLYLQVAQQRTRHAQLLWQFSSDACLFSPRFYEQPGLSLRAARHKFRIQAIYNPANGRARKSHGSISAHL